MPVYNESPDRVFSGIRAMIHSLREGGDAPFDVYVLSDSTDHEIWLQEEVAWANLSAELEQDPAAPQLFYRHRPQNLGRKSGNIEDFVHRWGSGYDAMIVLDADSLVDGSTMREMVARMEQDDRLAILQVPPVPIGRRSVFARLQQFSASVYGPIYVEGYSLWSGNQGNYWGHNAIIRVEAFRQCCQLPVLSGTLPFGGEIFSHDFVEAAFLVRHGWKVQLATDLGGSYEECPTTLADFAKRDQRWCQGNLQHLKLLISGDLHPVSRMHMGNGIFAYLASPIWVLFTILALAGTIVERSTTEGLVSGGALYLFASTMSLLLVPKFWSILLLAQSPDQRRWHGGWVGLIGSVLLEILLSVLLAPLMAIYHTRFVLAALRGRRVSWAAQQRDECGVTWSEARGQFLLTTLIGWLVFTLVALIQPSLIPWFSPVLLGAIASIPLAVFFGSQRIGEAMCRHKLLQIPAEVEPPTLCQHHARELQRSADLSETNGRTSWFEALLWDPRLFQLHDRIQRAGDSELSLLQARREELTTEFGRSGVAAISPADRRAILADSQILREWHSLVQAKVLIGVEREGWTHSQVGGDLDYHHA